MQASFVWRNTSRNLLLKGWFPSGEKPDGRQKFVLAANRKPTAEWFKEQFEKFRQNMQQSISPKKWLGMKMKSFITLCKKSVNWIKGQDDSAEIQDTYSAFFDSISTVIMGKRTYNQITTELSPDKWSYSGAITYVFTHDASMADRMDIKFTNADPCKLVNKLRTGTGKNIWICGGADVINQLLKKDLIDMFHISIIPVILGGGTKLFEEAVDMINLELVNTLNYNGIIEVVYKRR